MSRVHIFCLTSISTSLEVALQFRTGILKKSAHLPKQTNRKGKCPPAKIQDSEEARAVLNRYASHMKRKSEKRVTFDGVIRELLKESGKPTTCWPYGKLRPEESEAVEGAYAWSLLVKWRWGRDSIMACWMESQTRSECEWLRTKYTVVSWKPTEAKFGVRWVYVDLRRWPCEICPLSLNIPMCKTHCRNRQSSRIHKWRVRCKLREPLASFALSIIKLPHNFSEIQWVVR